MTGAREQRVAFFAKFLGSLWFLVLLLLSGCSAPVDSSDENVGSISQATTSCLTPAVAGECRYQVSVASASSVESNDSSLTAEQAVDSSCGTRWSSAFSDPQWLKLDLGSKRPVARLIIHWQNAASSAYQLQVSNDNSTWTTVATKANATITGSGDSRVDTIAGLSASARYIRLYSTARTTTYGNSVFEIEVFGTGCSAPTSCSWIPASPASAAASSSENASKGPDKAIDGQSSTRWSSAASDPQWLRLDLGKSTAIGRVQLDWENASSAKYDLQVSESTSGPWTTIFSHVDARTGARTDDLAALNGKGRYLRINSTKRTTSSGNSLFEVRVFRQSCETCEQILPSNSTTASSAESTAYAASYATDGDYVSRWSSQFSDPQWLRLDLGAVRRLKQVIVKWESAASKSYRLETSNSASGPWVVQATRTNQPAGPRVDTITDLAISARYLRLYSTARTTTYGNSIVEILAIGGANPLACDFACPGGANLDTDSDGTPNCLDACPKDPQKTKPGVCDCGNADVDSDSDGLLNCKDRCPNDPTNACPSNLDLGEYVPAPGPYSTVQPVNQSTCNEATVLPAALTLPGGLIVTDERLQAYYGAQLAPHFDATARAPATISGACTPIQEAVQCAIDPATVTNVNCFNRDTSQLDDTKCAGLGANFRCGLALPPGCPLSPDAEGVCKLPQALCGQLEADCVNRESIPSGCEGSNSGCCNPNATQQECPCSESELCSDDLYTGPSTPNNPNAYVPQAHKPSSDKIVKQPAPPPQYTDPANDPPNTPPGTGCQKRGDEGYCWCTLGMDQPAPVVEAGQTESDHGGGSLISLKFTPNSNFEVDLNPLPFGEALYTVDASASFKAHVDVDLPLIGKKGKDILDVGAAVRVQRCSLDTSETHFRVLGEQFTDLAGNEPFSTSANGSDLEKTLASAAAACEDSLGQFLDAADRAKKALKDIETLVKLYNALASNKTWGKTEFCALLEDQNDDPGFPAGNCKSAPIEDTLNRYIDYYRNRVETLVAKMADVPGKSQAMFDALKAVQSGDINFLDFHRAASVTVANAQFFVGPIPVNITVDVAANYGVDGILKYEISPFNRFGLQVGDTARVVGVTGSLIPSAGSSIAVFAGVGFDVPGFAVKAGVEGRLVLAEIRANLSAGSGLSMRIKDDLRGQPTDAYYTALSAINENQLYFKPTQAEYFLDWFYSGKLAIPKVLEGTINAKVKLKALFFSKTFKKTFLTFGPLFSLPETTLFSGGGEFGNVELPDYGALANSLGDFEMQTPLPMLSHLPPRTGSMTDQPFVFPTSETPIQYNGVCDIEIDNPK